MDAALSGWISVLIDRLAPEDVFRRYFRGKKDLDELLRKLNSRLNQANTLVKIAKQKQLVDPDVKNWHDELKYVITKAVLLAEDVDCKVKEGGSASQVRQILNFFSFKRTVIDRLKEILEMLGDLLERDDRLHLIEHVQSDRWKELPTPLVTSESEVYGRDQDKEKIVDLLLSDDVGDRNLSLIHIVGMCGSGKDTITQLIYKDDWVRRHFQLIEEFTLSTNTTPIEVVKMILERGTNRPCNTEDPLQLQRELYDGLNKEKFLFVLNNVWEENPLLWDVLLRACESGARGSKIIMMMRSSKLAISMPNVAMHELPLLSDDDCWKIFANHVFPDVNFDKHSELKEIGMKIVKECQGLPLAVKSMAGVLRSVTNLERIRETQQKWSKIWDGDIWELQFEVNQASNVRPPLLSSYLSLSPELKRCLAVCLIFPKGYQFRESDGEHLIRFWMGLGLLKPDNGKRMEDVGKAYLEALISKSFFQYSKPSKQEFMMHNFVREFTKRISGEVCFACGDSIDVSKLGTNFYHLSYEKEGDLRKLLSLSEIKRLRTLIALPLPSDSGGNNQVPLSSISGENNQVLGKSHLDDLIRLLGRCCQVLSVPKSATEIPKSIKRLKHLANLDASHSQVKRLPDDICSLLNLLILRLSDCKQLRVLPSKLAELVNLRHLDIRGTSVEKMPPNMGKMKNLETLSDFISSKDGGSRIKELAGLQRLGGSLCIKGLENIVDINDADAANLKVKKFLSELILIWTSDSDASHQKEVLNVLRPHTNLEQLTIEGYRGTPFPDWVGDKAFCNMVEVKLIECKNSDTLPPFGDPYLRRLEMGKCEKLWENRTNWHLQRLQSLTSLELWGIEEVVDSFPEEELLPTTLTELSIGDFGKLKGLNSRAFQHLTSLQLLKIRGCPELECLPEGLPSSLSCLIIEGCPQLVQRCQRGTGDDWSKIQHIPTMYIDDQLI